MQQFPPHLSRRTQLLARLAFLAVSALATLALIAALVGQLKDASGLPTWMVLLPLLGTLLLLAELFALLAAWDALRTNGSDRAELDTGAAPGRTGRALRPPRDVTDLPMQSAGGIVLHLEYAGLPAGLLAGILDEVSYAHQDAAYRIAGTLVTGLVDAAVLPQEKAPRLTIKLVDDQVVAIDTISTRHSVTIVVAVGFVMLVGGAGTAGKLIYEQLVQEVADEVREVLFRDAGSAVRKAVQRFVSRSSERILNRANVRITAQPWREVKSRRQDRVISEAVLDPDRPAVPVWPAEGYDVEPSRPQRAQMEQGGERGKLQVPGTGVRRET